jgi:hypothetical protein
MLSPQPSRTLNKSPFIGANNSRIGGHLNSNSTLGYGDDHHFAPVDDSEIKVIAD